MYGIQSLSVNNSFLLAGFSRPFFVHYSYDQLAKQDRPYNGNAMAIRHMRSLKRDGSRSLARHVDTKLVVVY